MKTLGQVLQALREKQDLTVKQLSQKSFVPFQVLQDLEQEQFENLPTAALVRGYLQLLAPILETSEETLLALYRRDVQEKDRGKSSPSVRKNRSNKWRNAISLSPSRMLSFLVAGIAVFSLAFLAFWQWRNLSQPPQLTVEQPAPFSIVKSPVLVVGKTRPENTVTINTESVSLNPQGEFSSVLQVPPGERTLVIRSTDSRGRTSDVILFVTVEEE